MGKISASIMCADLFNLESEIRELEQCKVDYLHLDVMDGSFVPNITLGLSLVRNLKKISNMNRDIHLLVNHPERYADKLELDSSDLLTFHYESIIGEFDTMNKVKSVKHCIETFKKQGCKVGLVLNPETPVNVIEPFIADIELVNLMMIHPGFAGLKMIDGMLEKISQMRQFLDGHGGKQIIIEVDGNVTFEHAVAMKRYGGDIFVAGSSSLFSKQHCKIDAYKKLKQILI